MDYSKTVLYNYFRFEFSNKKICRFCKEYIQSQDNKQLNQITENDHVIIDSQQIIYKNSLSNDLPK